MGIHVLPLSKGVTMGTINITGRNETDTYVGYTASLVKRSEVPHDGIRELGIPYSCVIVAPHDEVRMAITLCVNHTEHHVYVIEGTHATVPTQ